MSQLRTIGFLISNVSLRNVRHPKLYFTVSIPGKVPTPLYRSPSITSETSNPAWKKEFFEHTHTIVDINDTRNRIVIEVYGEDGRAFIGSVTVPFCSLIAGSKRKRYSIMNGKYPDSKLVFDFSFQSVLSSTFTFENFEFKKLNGNMTVEWHGVFSVRKMAYSIRSSCILTPPETGVPIRTYVENVDGLSRDDLLGSDVVFSYCELLPGYENCGRHGYEDYRVPHRIGFRVNPSDLEYEPVRIKLHLQDQNISISTTLVIRGLGIRTSPAMGPGIVPGSVSTAPGKFRDDKAGLGDEYIERYDKAGKKYFLNILTGESKYIEPIPLKKNK